MQSLKYILVLTAWDHSFYVLFARVLTNHFMLQSLDSENLRTAWVFHYAFDIGPHLGVLFSVYLLFDGSSTLFVFLFLCHNEVVPDVIFPEAFDLFLQFAGSNPAVPECILNFLLCQTCWVFMSLLLALPLALPLFMCFCTPCLSLNRSM